MLQNESIKAFVPTVNPEVAREFYTNVLGLKLLGMDKYALEYECNGVLLRVRTVNEFQPYPFTTLGWNVENIKAVIEQLNGKGVFCEKYGFFEQDDLGVWVSPDGSKVAWFKDPDGNTLSLTEVPVKI